MFAWWKSLLLTMLPSFALSGFVFRGPSGFHARLAGDVRARVPASFLPALGGLFSLGASGVHARLNGDVRAGPRLLPPLRTAIGFDIVAPAAPFAAKLATVPSVRSLAAMSSSLVVPTAIAIAIGCSGYRAVGAPRYGRIFRNVSMLKCSAMMFLHSETSGTIVEDILGRHSAASKFGNLPPLQVGMGGGPRFWGVGATPGVSAPTIPSTMSTAMPTKEFFISLSAKSVTRMM